MMHSEGRWPLELLGTFGSPVEPGASLRAFTTATCCLLDALSGALAWPLLSQAHICGVAPRGHSREHKRSPVLYPVGEQMQDYGHSTPFPALLVAMSGPQFSFALPSIC